MSAPTVLQSALVMPAISACEKGEQSVKALELLAEVRCSRLHPNIITYNASISACEKRRAVKALELMEEVRSSRLQPDVSTYSATISACCSGVHPNISTFNALISACEKGVRGCYQRL